MKLKNLLISILFTLLVVASLLSFSSCGDVVREITPPPSSESVPPDDDECTNSVHNIHAADGRLVTFSTNRVYTFTDLEYYFGARLSGLEFFDNEVITCEDAGHARFKCESCEKWVLIDVIDEHEYIYDKDATVVNEFGAEVIFKCRVCGHSENATVSYFKATKVDADCSNEGYTSISYEYKFMGDTESVSITIPTGAKDLTKHKYNNKIISTEVVYRLSELPRYFGTSYDGFQISGNSYDCVNHGSGMFTCDDCNSKIVLNILKDHELIFDKDNSLIDENNFTVEYKCKNCDHTVSAENVKTEVEERLADCAHTGGRYLAYSYTIDNVIYTGDKLLGDEYDIVSTNHKYKSNIVDENAVYTLDELKQIFGNDMKDFTILGNSYNCTKYGYGVFTCNSCNKKIVLSIVGDHSYELDSELSVITEDELSLVGLCKFCREDEVPLETTFSQVVIVPSTCSENGKKNITFEYVINGKNAIGDKDLEGYELNAHIHTYNDELIDDEEIHTIESLKLIFGEDLQELTILSEFPSCDEDSAGRSEYVCDSCEETITLLIRTNHEYERVDAECVYTKDSVKLVYKCSVCNKVTVFEDIIPEYFFEKATSTSEGKEYIKYSFILDDKKITDEYVFETYPIDKNSHIYNGECIYSSKVYTMEQLAEIFGDDYEGLAFYVNDGNYASYVCEDCGDLIILAVDN